MELVFDFTKFAPIFALLFKQVYNFNGQILKCDNAKIAKHI